MVDIDGKGNYGKGRGRELSIKWGQGMKTFLLSALVIVVTLVVLVFVAVAFETWWPI